jgi:hypothetical protein
MAVLVVVGVVVSSGDDTDFTRNTAFGVPKLGGDLNDQVQQPGDAENDFVLAMAAAAKCGEGHVLISTGDPVSPWRCGPLLAAMPTMEDVRGASLLPEHSPHFRPCQHIYESHSYANLGGDQVGNVSVARYRNTMAMLHCINDWANGRTVEAVENVLRVWIGLLEHTNVSAAPYCVEVFEEIAIERAPGNGGNNAVSGLGSFVPLNDYRCDA